MCSIINNLQSVARLSGNTCFVPAPKNFGLGAAAILGGASLFGGALSGIFGSSSQSSANRTNLKIWREQKEFNRVEAEKQRQWQQRMQEMYGTSSAKANDLRAAGLNAKLGDVSASSVGTGATATAPNAPEIRPYNAGADIAQGINNAAQTFIAGYNSDTQRRAQQSQQNVNESLSALYDSTSKLNYKKIDLNDEAARQLRLNNDFLQDTFSSRVRQQYTQERIALWNEQDTEYNALTNRFSFFYLLPEQVINLQSQSAYNQAQMFKALAEGQLTLKDVEFYEKNLSIRQTMATAAMISARAQETSSAAALMNAKEYSKLLHSQKVAQDIKNEYDRYANDFWLGNLPPESISKSAPLRPLLQSTLDLNMYTARKMYYEPGLVKAMTENYHVQSGLFKSQSNYYDWKKWSDAVNAGSNAVRAGAGAAGTFAGSAAKAFLK